MGLTLITGGARSGKSTFAEKLVKEWSQEKENNAQEVGVLYIATAIPFDDEMRERIRNHQVQRPKHWRTVERYQGLDQIIAEAPEKIILLDCITVMLTNIIFSTGIDEKKPDVDQVRQIEEEIVKEIDKLISECQSQPDCELVIVTNELGMGLVPVYPLGRIFRDIAGRINQRIAASSDRVYFVISGIPTLIKGVN